MWWCCHSPKARWGFVSEPLFARQLIQALVHDMAPQRRVRFIIALVTVAEVDVVALMTGLQRLQRLRTRHDWLSKVAAERYAAKVRNADARRVRERYIPPKRRPPPTQ
jgi:butyrate kinase